MKETLTALLAGLLFGAGLAVSQMTNPAKVIGFLDVSGNWDPSLAFVMGAALLVTALGVRLDPARHRNAAGQPGPTPATAAGIDRRLLTGASLFGLGWGVAGFCPGPAIASLVTGSGEVALFVVAMLAGMGLFTLFERSPQLQPGKATGGQSEC